MKAFVEANSETPLSLSLALSLVSLSYLDYNLEENQTTERIEV